VAEGGKVFARIARRYDRINTLLSLGQDQKWRQTALDQLPPGRILDLGGGTGAANEVFGDREVVSLDPAAEMLSLNPVVQRVVGAGEQLPFRGGTFDAVFSAYVFRNLDSVSATLEEIARVLRPGGRAGIVDLGRPEPGWRRSLHRAGTAVVLPTVGTLAGAREEYVYLNRSLDKLPPPEDLLNGSSLSLLRTWRMGPFGFVYGAILEKPTETPGE
jgi:demethylmenaquinone methyltransferase/2-methoxy-6-polyprenyl-1,4-benzoquinol methylase